MRTVYLLINSASTPLALTFDLEAFFFGLVESVGVGFFFSFFFSDAVKASWEIESFR